MLPTDVPFGLEICSGAPHPAKPPALVPY